MKVLLAFTTYNQIEYTKKLVGSLKKINMPNLDVIFIDDVSKDGTQKFLKESKLNLIERKQPKGLTWSWNIAYRKFKTEGYDILIIANNDILFTNKSLKTLINATNGRKPLAKLDTGRKQNTHCRILSLAKTIRENQEKHENRRTNNQTRKQGF